MALALWDLMRPIAIGGGVATAMRIHSDTATLATLALSGLCGITAGMVGLHLSGLIARAALAHTSRESIFLAVYVVAFMGLFVLGFLGAQFGAWLSDTLLH